MNHEPKKGQTEFTLHLLLQLSLHTLFFFKQEMASQGSSVRPTGHSGFMCLMFLWTGLWHWDLVHQATEVLLFTRTQMRKVTAVVMGCLQLLWTWRMKFIMFYIADQQPRWQSLWVRRDQNFIYTQLWGWIQIFEWIWYSFFFLLFLPDLRYQ